MIRITLVLAMLATLTGCSIFPKRAPEPQRVPVACAPAALAPCEPLGVTAPAVLTADAAALLAELAVRAWTACSTRHAQLITCVRKHAP